MKASRDDTLNCMPHRHCPGNCGWGQGQSSCGFFDTNDGYEVYEEETVRIRKKYPKGTPHSSLNFSPREQAARTDYCGCQQPNSSPKKKKASVKATKEYLKENDIKLRGNGLSGGIDEVIVYVRVDSEDVPLRVSKGDDYEARALDFCFENQITHSQCVDQITDEISSQMSRSPHIQFTT